MGGTVEGWRQIDELERQARESEDRRLRERFVALSSEAYGQAAAYDNAIIVAGYAAFFALWSGSAGDITRLARVTTLALMGISLLLYITWHMIQMLTRQSFDRERAAAFAFQNDFQKFDELWKDVERRRGIGLQRVLRFWPYIFIPSLVSGFAGAAVLTYSALSVVLGLPQLGK